MFFLFSFFLSTLSGSEMSLVDIQTVNPRIVVDLRYATTDNFTGQAVYDFQICFLHKEVAKALSQVQDELESIGLGVKVWDGYRPMSVQWQFWKLVPDERYISDPRKGGRHTRGTAVDLTLIDKEGSELPMPTSFDDFSEKAHANCSDVPVEQKANRELLKKIMEKHGFIGLSTEWWHFDFAGWENFPPLDTHL
jgi:D-alanyl-D-alanine dipeptidase